MPSEAERREIIERYCAGSPAQSADGVDLSLIRANLRLTATERVQRNYEYRRQIERLHGSARRIR